MAAARIAYRLHRWLGAVFGGFVAVLALTGALLVFRAEIDRLATPGLPILGKGAPLSMGAVMEGWHADNPDATVESVEFPIDAYGQRDWSMPFEVWARLEGSDGVRRWLLDPYTGDALEPPAVNIGQIIRNIHIELLLGGGPTIVRFLALIFVGVVGFAYFFSILTGAIFHRRTMVREMTCAIRTRNAKVLLSDVHKRFAVWALPLHLLTAATGAFLGLEVIAVPFSDGDGAPDVVLEQPDNPGKRPDYDCYVSAASNAIPAAEPLLLKLPNGPGEAVVVVMRNDQRLIHHYASEVHLHPQSAVVLEADDVAAADFWRRFYHMIEPLHFGYYGGLPVRILYSLFGLSLAGLAFAGLYLWWSRRQLR